MAGPWCRHQSSLVYVTLAECIESYGFIGLYIINQYKSYGLFHTQLVSMQNNHMDEMTSDVRFIMQAKTGDHSKISVHKSMCY